MTRRPTPLVDRMADANWRMKAFVLQATWFARMGNTPACEASFKASEREERRLTARIAEMEG